MMFYGGIFLKDFFESLKRNDKIQALSENSLIVTGKIDNSDENDLEVHKTSIKFYKVKKKVKAKFFG